MCLNTLEKLWWRLLTQTQSCNELRWRKTGSFLCRLWQKCSFPFQSSRHGRTEQQQQIKAKCFPFFLFLIFHSRSTRFTWLARQLAFGIFLTRYIQEGQRVQWPLQWNSGDIGKLKSEFPRVHTFSRCPLTIGYIGMCGAKGYGFLAVLVWMVSILIILVWNRVWFVPL